MEQDSRRARDTILTDYPVESRDEDLLGRTRFAGHLASQISASPGGMVFGLTGPWGSGKTSVVNMMQEFLEEGASGDGDHENSDPKTGVEERPVVIHFNPGLFSGTEQLVEHFFEELAAQFMETGDSRLQRVGKFLADYGPMLGSLRFVPGIGEAMGVAGSGAKTVGRLLEGREDDQPASVHERREQIRSALDDQPRRVIVIIDDLDRLRPQEVRDMVKLVRLNADFPKTTYLLCYDRERVERALGATDVFSEEDTAVGEVALAEGRSYLEKIVQLSYDVPGHRRSDLKRILVEGLETRLENAIPGGIEAGLDRGRRERLGEILHKLVGPLMLSLRDVKRYLNALSTALYQTRGEVAPEDVVALEAVRLQLPSVYSHIVLVGDALTHLPEGEAITQLPFATARASSPHMEAQPPSEAPYRTAVEKLVTAAGEDERRRFVAKKVVDLLFPAAVRHLPGRPAIIDPTEWRRERRVADWNVLSTYLIKQMPPDEIPTADVTEIIGAAADRERLRELVANRGAESLEKLIERIRDYAPDFDDEAFVNIAEVFLTSLPQRRRVSSNSVFLQDYLDPEHKVYGLIAELLRSMHNDEERDRVVEKALPYLTTLTAQVDLIEIAVQVEGYDDSLVSPQKSEELEQRALDLILEATPDRIAAERRPIEILDKALQFEERLGLTFEEKVEGKESRAIAYVVDTLEDDGVWLAVLKDCVGYWYGTGRDDLKIGEEIFQPERLFAFIEEEELAEHVRRLAEQVEAGNLPLEPESPEAKALRLAEEHFNVSPGDPGTSD